MTIFPQHNTAGLIYSIIGLSLVAPVCFIFRKYFRGLDFIQMAYLFSKVLAYSTSTFSNNLQVSIVRFNYNFLTFCTQGDLVCAQGFQLSFTICIAGPLLLLFLVFSIEKCKREHLRFQPIYCLLKGFFKWTYIPLTFTSTTYLIQAINLNKDLTTYIIPPAAILGVLCLFPIIQLICYKYIQNQETNIWIKWIQFFDYLRLLSVGALMGVAFYYTDTFYCHFVMIPLLLYSLIYVWKGEFRYSVLERIIAVVGELAFLAVFYLFKYRSRFMQQYDLDFFLLGGVLLIDSLLYLVRGIRLGCYGLNEVIAEVNPEVAQDNLQKVQAIPYMKTKQTIKYEQVSREQLQPSRKELNTSKPLIKKKK